MNENQALWMALTASVVAISCGIIFALAILKKPAGSEKMQEIAGAIQEGANAFLNRQYLAISIVGALIFLVLGFALSDHWRTAGGFLVGAILSGLTGYIGMNISVRANVRTAQAAYSGMNAALSNCIQRWCCNGFIGCWSGSIGNQWLLPFPKVLEHHNR